MHSNLHIKVKFSHTRYRALGPELIPVYEQSRRRRVFKSSPAEIAFTYRQPKNVTVLRPLDYQVILLADRCKVK